MTDDQKSSAYRIGSGASVGFALSGVKIAPLNPDGSYGEAVPLPESQILSIPWHKWSDKTENGLDHFSLTGDDFDESVLASWTFRARSKKEARRWTKFFLGSYNRKALHRWERKKARLLKRGWIECRMSYQGQDFQVLFKRKVD